MIRVARHLWAPIASLLLWPAIGGCGYLAVAGSVPTASRQSTGTRTP